MLQEVILLSGHIGNFWTVRYVACPGHVLSIAPRWPKVTPLIPRNAMQSVKSTSLTVGLAEALHGVKTSPFPEDINPGQNEGLLLPAWRCTSTSVSLLPAGEGGTFLGTVKLSGFDHPRTILQQRLPL